MNQTTPTIAVIAQGSMGAGVAKRLTDNGVRVLTSLAGRSEASAARAKDAGMIDASDAEIAAADVILSIVPPGDALPLAQRLAPALTAVDPKPLYADCNAVSPDTVKQIAAAIAPTGARLPTPASSAVRRARAMAVRCFIVRARMRRRWHG